MLRGMLLEIPDEKSSNCRIFIGVRSIQRNFTTVQVLIHDYCWVQTPAANVTRGRVVITWRNIGVLERRPFRAKFTTSWSVPLAGSASCTTSLCKYLSILYIYIVRCFLMLSMFRIVIRFIDDYCYRMEYTLLLLSLAYIVRSGNSHICTVTIIL